MATISALPSITASVRNVDFSKYPGLQPCNKFIFLFNLIPSNTLSKSHSLYSFKLINVCIFHSCFFSHHTSSFCLFGFLIYIQKQEALAHNILHPFLSSSSSIYYYIAQDHAQDYAQDHAQDHAFRACLGLCSRGYTFSDAPTSLISTI